MPVAWKFVSVAVLSCFAFIQRADAQKVYRRPFERVASMDPIRASDVASAQAVTLVYEPMLEVDYFTRPYKLKPCVCEMPEVDASGKVYSFKVREGVFFTNGDAVKAADVVRGLKRLSDKANASAGMWTMADVESVSEKSGNTVEIVLKKKSHVFPWLMAMAYTGVMAEDGCGSGPYTLVNWRKNHEMHFRKNPSYRNPVAIDELRFLVIDDVSTAWLMFLNGELDYLGGISRDNWDAVVGKDGSLHPQLKNRGMTLMSTSSLSVFYIGINMKDPVLGPNRYLRQALNCAFDFPAWKRFLNNRITQIDGPLPPSIAGRLETPFAYSYNLKKVAELLAKAGFPGGVDPKTGRRLHLEITYGRATQDTREMAELLASFYDRIGIELDAKYMTWDAFLTAVNEGRTQMFNLGWIGDYPDPENFLQLFHSKNLSPGANHGCYINPEFDKAFDSMDWLKAQEIVREDCPWIFLYSPKTYCLIWNRVKNYQPSDFAYGIEKYLDISMP
jgi:ABC-type transport system substrate-binding protein